MITVAVGALEGKIEVYVETAGIGAPEPLQFEPSHQGLMQLWSLFQMLGPTTVCLLPESTVSHLTGLPEGFDLPGLVKSAHQLASMGWYSCVGGTA